MATEISNKVSGGNFTPPPVAGIRCLKIVAGTRVNLISRRGVSQSSQSRLKIHKKCVEPNSPRQTPHIKRVARDRCPSPRTSISSSPLIISIPRMSIGFQGLGCSAYILDLVRPIKSITRTPFDGPHDMGDQSTITTHNAC
jgi:hypothetical protein